MKYEIKQSFALTEIRLSGRMCFDDHDLFRGVLDAIEGNSGHRIILDLTELSAIDSAGLGMLIIAGDHAAKKGLAFDIRNPAGLVKKLMELACLSKHMSVTFT